MRYSILLTVFAVDVQTHHADEVLVTVIAKLVHGLYEWSLKALPLYQAQPRSGQIAIGKPCQRRTARPILPVFPWVVDRLRPCWLTIEQRLLPHDKSVQRRLQSSFFLDGDINTVYGEITKEGLAVFIPYYKVSASSNFLDLGSGKGASVLNLYSLFPQAASITGIEYVQERHDAAVDNIRAAFTDAPIPTSTSEYHYNNIHLYAGDMFDVRFSKIIEQARFVYVANLLFPREANQKLNAVLRLNTGAIVVSCIPLSNSSIPTVLFQSWDEKAKGYIWRTGNGGHDGENGGEFLGPKHWCSLGAVGGRTVQGKYYTSNECFQESLAVNPEYPDAWYNLGVAGGGIVDGKYYGERECLQTSIRFDSKSAKAWNCLGDVGGGIVDGKQYSGAECFRMSLVMQGENAQAWYLMGVAGGSRSRGQSPKECFGKALMLDPNMAMAWYDLGALGGGIVRPENYNVTECFQKALALDPMLVNAWYGLHNLHGGTVNGKYYDESECFENALALDPVVVKT